MDNDLPGDEQNKEISAAELDADIDALLRLKPGSTAATELPLSSDRRQRVEAAADAARQAKQRRRSTPSQPPLQPDQNLTVSVDQPQLTLPTTQPVSPSPAPQRTSPSPAPQRASRTSYRLTPPAATHTETDTLDGLGITPVDQMKPAPAAGEAAVETAPPASGLPPKIKTGQTGPGAAADTPSTDHPAAPAATRR
ncbi:MAG: hypothetical protein FWC59_03060, partial [Actinomycetia bacterium]|nr:hypothetical protein [Actinomycetes bacterium]